MKTFYFSLENLVFICTETTPGNVEAGNAGKVAHVVQFIYNLSH